jgi:hypothetical protein
MAYTESGRRIGMRSLDSHRLMAALYLLVFSMAVGISARADEVENMIGNGDFEEGLIEWNLGQSE